MRSADPQPAPFEVLDLGLVEYAEAHRIQQQRLQALVERKVPDALLLMEHPCVITLGRGAHEENLHGSAEIPIVPIERGGDVTLHAPGQLVGYLIRDLREGPRDLHAHLRRIEGALINALDKWGLTAGRREGLTGVWIGDRKIASIGVACRQWCTWHGFALNVNTDLSLFSRINPCGLDAAVMTSMERELGAPLPFAEVAEIVGNRFADAFSRPAGRVDDGEGDA